MREREELVEVMRTAARERCLVTSCENCKYKDEGGCLLRLYADAIIEAGFISLKKSSDMARETCDILRNIKDDEIKRICKERDDFARRAEVAERALLLMARGECTFASPEFYKEEAEKEIAMEEQMMANRCGEGKCEYFESIRRAANNNRGNGYCKKYKRELLFYDWWWLKCDECTAEKELAKEDEE